MDVWRGVRRWLRRNRHAGMGRDRTTLALARNDYAFTRRDLRRSISSALETGPRGRAGGTAPQDARVGRGSAQLAGNRRLAHRADDPYDGMDTAVLDPLAGSHTAFRGRGNV